MSKANEMIVHNAVNALCNCEVAPYAAPVNLPTHVMDLAHALLPRLAGSAPACCTLADLLTATYQLGMSRALASVAAGLEGQRSTHAEEIAKQLVGAVAHTMGGHGPASVRLSGARGLEDGAVVFVLPGPLGVIIDDALDALYAQLGWRVQKEGKGEGS